MYAATGEANMKWGAHILNGRTGTTAPPSRRVLVNKRSWWTRYTLKMAQKDAM